MGRITFRVTNSKGKPLKVKRPKGTIARIRKGARR